MTKTCTVCKQTLGYEHFHNSKVTKDGKGYRCRKCDTEARTQYRLNNLVRYKTISRNKQLKFKYGLSIEEYNVLLENQNHSCAICKCNVTSKRVKGSFAVDHNHTTGKIRGLLCNQCNRAIGMLNDSPELLQTALTYLQLGETH